MWHVTAGTLQITTKGDVGEVLVTGGSGRIGQALIAELLESGHSVVSVDQRRPAVRPESYRFVEIDVRDVGQVAGRACLLR